MISLLTGVLIAVCIEADKKELVRRIVRYQKCQTMRTALISAGIVLAVMAVVAIIVTLIIVLRPAKPDASLYTATTAAPSDQNQIE